MFHGWQAPLVQGLLGKVAVLILDSRGRVVEKYVVQLQVRLKLRSSLVLVKHDSLACVAR